MKKQYNITQQRYKEVVFEPGQMSWCSYAGIITFMLLVGKLLGIADLDWIWVFAPVWIPAAFVVLLGAAALAVLLIDKVLTRKQGDR